MSHNAVIFSINICHDTKSITIISSIIIKSTFLQQIAVLVSSCRRLWSITEAHGGILSSSVETCHVYMCCPALLSVCSAPRNGGGTEHPAWLHQPVWPLQQWIVAVAKVKFRSCICWHMSWWTLRLSTEQASGEIAQTGLDLWGFFGRSILHRVRQIAMSLLDGRGFLDEPTADWKHAVHNNIQNISKYTQRSWDLELIFVIMINGWNIEAKQTCSPNHRYMWRLEIDPKHLSLFVFAVLCLFLLFAAVYHYIVVLKRWCQTPHCWTNRKSHTDHRCPLLSVCWSQSWSATEGGEARSHRQTETS